MNVLDEIIKYITLPKIILTAIIIIAALIIGIFLKYAFKKVKDKSSLNDDQKSFSAFMVTYDILRIILVVVAVILVLQVNGVNVTSFVAGLGLLSAVIGLALQDSLKDIFMGFIIMIDKFYRVGDAVHYDGKDGIVISFNVRTTKIQFLDDQSIHSVANRNISEITKLTHLVDIDLPLPYEEDTKKVYETLSEISKQIAELDGVEGCTFKGTQDFSDSAIIYKIRFFCDPKNRPDIRRAVLKLIQDELNKSDIKIPYQQVDIHTK